MTLEDRIARLINPDIPWDEPSDKTCYRWLDWELCGGNRAAARAAARRVIDGLNLDITTIMGHAGHITGIIIGHIDPQEDA